MPLNLSNPIDPGPCLYVVATPIGNLADITLRAIDVLTQVDLIAAEDTRLTQRLLTAHGIQNKLISYHEHNENRRTPELIDKLVEGLRIALVSDAGTPMVSDPGYRLIATAVERGIPVVPIPGVSAAITALSASGLATDSFIFIGFPARKKNKRMQQLQTLTEVTETLIFYQSPSRIALFIAELQEVMGDRTSVLARELTKLHEEFIRGPLSQIQAELAAKPAIKGECTLLVQGATKDDIPDEADLESLVGQALARSEQPIAEMARTLSRRWGIPKNRIYDLALKLKKKD